MAPKQSLISDLADTVVLPELNTPDELAIKLTSKRSKTSTEPSTKSSSKKSSKSSAEPSVPEIPIFEHGPKDYSIPQSIYPLKYTTYQAMSHVDDYPPANVKSTASDKCFTLTPKYPCDIFSKPPEQHVFDAPIFYNTIHLDDFQRCRVTVSSKWETQYDQGGLILVLPKDGTAAGGKWIKTGLEYFNDKTFVSTVVKDRWADWSLTSHKGNEVTLEMERKDKALWINLIDGKRTTPIREVTWLLHEKDQPIWVGVYAAKPKEGGKRDLEVKFKDWQLETIDVVRNGHTTSELTENDCKDKDGKHARKCNH